MRFNHPLAKPIVLLGLSLLCTLFCKKNATAQSAITFADSTQLLLVFEDETDTLAINGLKDSLNAIELGVSPLTRVHLWKIPEDTIAAYGGPIGIMNHALGKSVVQGGELNFEMENDRTNTQGDNCYSINYNCPADSFHRRVAIMDTGIDGIETQQCFWQTHPAHNEFLVPVPRLAINPNEMPCNNIDDDFNFYLDDEKGWDYVNNDPVPLDFNSHGTHVAGIIGKYLGMNSDTVTDMMILQTQDALGYGSLWHLVLATDYALMNGAKVINWSLAYLAVVDPNPKPRILEYVINYGKIYHGALFVASAGNDGINVDSIFTASSTSGPVQVEVCPARFLNDNLMIVASANCANQRSFFSNYGAISVDIAAPGEAILSTIPHGIYGLKSGTSMAAPHVSTNAALMGTENELFHWKSIKERMMQFSTFSPALAPITVSGRMLDFCGAYPVNGPLSAMISADSTLCLGSTTTLTVYPSGGLGPYSYLWSTGETTQTISIGLPMVYEVTITDNSGATATDKANVTAISQPPMLLMADTIDCNSTSSTLTLLNPTYGTRYFWSNGYEGYTQTVAPTSTTVYSVTASLASGCKFTGSIEVAVLNLDMELPKDTICRGECATLAPLLTDAVPPILYSWNTGSNDPSITVCPIPNTNYYLTVMDARGCTKTRQTRVFVGRIPYIEPLSLTKICYCDTAVLFADVSRGKMPYSFEWTPTGETTQSIAVSPSTIQNYWVTATDSYSCSTTRKMRVKPECKRPTDLFSAIDTAQQEVTMSWLYECPATRHQVSWRCSPTDPWTVYNILNPSNTSSTINWDPSCNDFQWRVRTRCCGGSYSKWTSIQTPSFAPSVHSRDGVAESPFFINPNPNNGFCTLTFEEPQKTGSLKLFDAFGKLLYVHSLNGNTHQLQLHLEDFPAGLYFLQFEGEKTSFLEKIVKE